MRLNAARDGERLALAEAEKSTQEAAEADSRAAPDALGHQTTELRALESRVVRAEATTDSMSELVTQLREVLQDLKLASRSSAKISMLCGCLHYWWRRPHNEVWLVGVPKC